MSGGPDAVLWSSSTYLAIARCYATAITQGGASLRSTEARTVTAPYFLVRDQPGKSLSVADRAGPCFVFGYVHFPGRPL